MVGAIICRNESMIFRKQKSSQMQAKFSNGARKTPFSVTARADLCARSLRRAKQWVSTVLRIPCSPRCKRERHQTAKRLWYSELYLFEAVALKRCANYPT